MAAHACLQAGKSSADASLGRFLRVISLHGNRARFASSAPESREEETFALSPAQALLRKMVLDSVPSPHTRRNYGKALDHLFAFCASRPLSRALLMVNQPVRRSGCPSRLRRTSV
jgi:hypothetical protein